jgi:orotidine-5'-phosphate decarboxylase
MINNQNIKFCLGIDPNPIERNFDHFKESVYKHMEILDVCAPLLKDHIIKPQLAFFLSYGSKGLLLLEELIARFQAQYIVILDAKFNDISTSLKAYLNFAFQSLGAHGITISPFLGEKSLQITFEECGRHSGKKGRVYVLCATSESSTNNLSFIQDNWQKTLLACSEIRDEIFQNEKSHQKIAGVVVGANRKNILLSEELKQSKLSVLVPGLGAQSNDISIIQNCKSHPNEITFPFSRAIFSGGNISTDTMSKNLTSIQQYF